MPFLHEDRILTISTERLYTVCLGSLLPRQRDIREKPNGFAQGNERDTDWDAKNTTLQNELEAMRRDKVASDSEAAVYGTKHSQYSPKSTLN